MVCLIEAINHFVGYVMVHIMQPMVIGGLFLIKGNVQGISVT
jgi:hypothetical protein